MNTSNRALSFVRALALLAPALVACEQQRTSFDPVQSGGASGEQSRADASASSEAVGSGLAVTTDASASAGPCAASLPANGSTCATDERCAYQATTNELISNRAPSHGDVQCECTSGQWECHRLAFVGPLAPPELEFV